jgi:hypothetical protein
LILGWVGAGANAATGRITEGNHPIASTRSFAGVLSTALQVLNADVMNLADDVVDGIAL